MGRISSGSTVTTGVLIQSTGEAGTADSEGEGLLLPLPAPLARESGLGQPFEAGKSKKMTSPRSFQKERLQCSHLDISPVRPFQTSDLQDGKIINWCCFNPPGVC